MFNFNQVLLASVLASLSAGCFCLGPTDYDAEENFHETGSFSYENSEYEYSVRLDLVDASTVPMYMPHELAGMAHKVTVSASELYDINIEDMHACMSNSVIIVIPDEDFNSFTDWTLVKKRGGQHNNPRMDNSTKGWYTNRWCFSLGNCDYGFIIKESVFESENNREAIEILVHEYTHRASYCAGGGVDGKHKNNTSWYDGSDLSTLRNTVNGKAFYEESVERGLMEPFTDYHYEAPEVVDCDEVDC